MTARPCRILRLARPRDAQGWEDHVTGRVTVQGLPSAPIPIENLDLAATDGVVSAPLLSLSA